MRAAGPAEREMAAFAERIFALIHNARPVRVYTGCGTSPATGFINIDIAPMLRPLEEIAKLVGYREVLFNQKNQPVSPLRGIDTWPWDDRDTLFGNIYADLLK